MEYRVSQLMKGHPNIVEIRSLELDQTIRIEGKDVVKDFLILDYCENSDLFEFMSKYSKRQNDAGQVSN
jgi:hypothetical protein